MPTARHLIVPATGDITLHLISRCVRRAFLCGEDEILGTLDHRKVWIRNRLAELAHLFGVEVMTYAFMSNHFHLVVSFKRSGVEAWSDEDVVDRWMQVFPKKFRKASRIATGGTMGEGSEARALHRRSLLADPETVAKLRGRLADSGWFMKALKEPISRLANQEDGVKGAFWDARYKSVLLEDPTAVMACMMYVDLNPLRAGLSKTVEAQVDVGLEQRLAEKRERFKEFLAEQEKRRQAGKEEGGRDHFRPVAVASERNWLKPMDGPFVHGSGQPLTLEAYIELLEHTAQRHRDGKAKMDPRFAGALQRLGLPSKAEAWDRLWRKMKPDGRCLRLAA